MELNKSILKSKTLASSIESALKVDLDKIVTTLLCENDIYMRGTKNLAKKDELMERLLDLYNIRNNVMHEFCCAVTSSGKRCTRRCQASLSYCKTHSYRSILDERQEQSNSLTTESNVFHVKPKRENVSTEKMEKKLIDDSFYYVDESFIYDVISHEKMGYVDLSGSLILTDDPFILNTLV
jgi:hypothetical protein